MLVTTEGEREKERDRDREKDRQRETERRERQRQRQRQRERAGASRIILPPGKSWAGVAASPNQCRLEILHLA